MSDETCRDAYRNFTNVLNEAIEDEVGTKLMNLVREQSSWSQATFGTDAERGPMGPLKHLEKEAREAQNDPKDIKEYADILILLLDSSRRAGFTIIQLIEAAQAKTAENRLRKWPVVTDMNAPVEHIKE